MRKIYALLFTVVLFFSVKVNAQITVTNPTNTTPNLLATYTSLASALTDLNAVTAMSGPVKFTIVAGYSETAPPTGLTIGSATLNPVLSATNTITIVKASGTVTLNAGVGTATPTSATPDGILKLVGADYVTIDGLSFVGGNATNPESMEYAIGLFKRAAGDGCNYNTIQNCTFTLPNVNNASATAPMIEGTISILVINSTPTAANTSLTPTNGGTLATNGTNSNNKFYSNTITGGNYGIGLSGFVASAGVGPTPLATTFLGDINNDIGGNALLTGNTILNFGGVAAATNPAAGIRANNQWNLNISYNRINNNDGAGINHPNILRGIYAQAGTSANVTINNNNVTVKGGGTTQLVYAIENVIGSTASNNTVNILHNKITGEYITSTTGAFYGIISTASAFVTNIMNDTVVNMSYGNSGVTGTGANYGIFNNGAATTVNVTNCLVNNVYRIGTTGGTTIGIYCSSGTNQNVKKNKINNLSIDGTGTASTMYGIQTATGIIVCDSNTVNNLRCIKTTGTGVLYGMYNISSPTNENYNYNLIDSITHYGTGTAYGLYTSTTTGTRVVSNNTIRNISTTGLTIAGIYMLSSSPSIFKNKIYNITSTSAAAPLVSGIHLGSFTTGGANIYNNLISDLYAPNATSSTVDVIRGINLNTTSSGNINVYFNTINLNAISSGADFSTSAIYHASSTVAGTATVDLRNNNIVNTSTANGAGTTVALRRNGGTTASSLSNFSNSSNYDNYYVGIPMGNNYIYYDGTTGASTIGDFQIFTSTAGNMAPRGSASVSVDPEFQSIDPLNANFLKYKTTSAKQIESGGINIAGITTDFVGTIRAGNVGYSGTGSAPDMGAWELNGIASFNCNTPAPGATLASNNNLCLGNSTTLSFQNPVSGTGLSYQWQSSTNGTTYSNIAGATNISYVATPTNIMYYRCAVTCQNGPVTVNSTQVQITFANSVTSKTDSARCGTGSVVLKATGSSGTTLKWYTDSTGGAAIGTGSPFNTPSISTTKKYYVGAEAIVTGDATFGTATTTNATTGYPSPYSNFYGGAKHQMLILASELTAAGISPGSPINSISFNVASVGSTFTGTLQDFQIDMGLTTSSVLSGSSFITGLTNVIPPSPRAITVGVNTHTLVSTFTWDGTSNIVVQTSYSNGNTGGTNDNVQMYYSDPGFSSTNYYRADGATSAAVLAATAPSGSGNLRPNIVLNCLLSCSSPRTAVTATVSTSAALTITANQTVCNNSVATISVTSNLTDYNTYKWTPTTNLFTDAACTVAYVSGASATTVYVKSSSADTTTYSCTSNNTTTLCSNLATTKVTTLPSVITISTPINSFCLSGTAIISTTPSVGYGAAIFQWQSSPNGTTYSDISGANSITYNATGVTSTTYYKLQIKLGSSTCVTSNAQTLTINNPSVLTTTPVTRCGTGIVNLAATGSSGATLNWYNTSSGGVSLGSGSSFTTPIISTTTPFYVGAENYAPGTATLGTSTATTTSAMGITPYGSFYEGARVQYLITADELRALGLGAGPITGMTFTVTASGGGTFAQTDFTIKFAHTSNVDLTSGYGTVNGAFQTVYGPVAEPVPAVGPVNYAFTTAFVWDGGSNVLIDICHDNDLTGTCTACYNPASSTVAYTATTNNSVYGRYGDNVPACGVLSTTTVSSTFRPNMTFTGNLVCSSVRTSVTATVTASPAVTMTAGNTVCNNSITALSVTSTISDYNTYKWTPATNLYTDVAATTAYVSGATATTVYFKSSTVGNVTYTVTGTQTSGSMCSNVATATMTVLPASITISASPAQLCFTGTSSLTTNPNTGFGTATYQWKSSPDSISFSSISGANANSYTTPTLTSTNFYKFEVKAGSTTCIESGIKVTVNKPTIDSFTVGVRCGPGTVTLKAFGSPSSSLNWYAASTGGAPLGSGSPFTTPSISATTYYYVAANNGGSSFSVGLPDNNASYGTFGSPGGTGYGLYFTTTIGMTLNSVYVYPQSAGTVTIQLQDGAGVLIPGQQYVATFVTGDIGIKTLVPVNFIIPSGGSYRLMNTAGGFLGRFNPYSGTAFPLTYGAGVLTLTQGSLGTTTYYSFFDWLVSTGCESTRSSVEARIEPVPASVTVSPNSFTQCTNSPAKVIKAAGGVGAGTYVWTPTTGLYIDFAATVAYTGGAKDSVYARPTSTTRYTATSTNASNCSSIDTSNIIVNCTLPVSLLNFAGVKENGINILRWTTSTEQNNKGFGVERSTDGINYTTIGFVTSKADNGYSSHELSYSYVDDKVNGLVNYYRLRQTDLDNRTTLSNTIVIKGDRVNTVKLSGLYPNPATEQVTVTIESPNAEKVVLVVTDIYGKQLLQKNVSVETGSNNTNINISQLSSGTYFIKLSSTKTNEISVLKFVKH